MTDRATSPDEPEPRLKAGDIRSLYEQLMETRRNPYAPPARDLSHAEATARAMAKHWAAFYRALMAEGVPEQRAAEWTQQRIQTAQYVASSGAKE